MNIDYEKEIIRLQNEQKDVVRENDTLIQEYSRYPLLHKSDSDIKEHKLLLRYKTVLLFKNVNNDSYLNERYNSYLKNNAINLVSVNMMYRLISDKYFSTITLIKLAKAYKENNYTINYLYNYYCNSLETPNSSTYLYKNPSLCLDLIKDEEVKQICIIMIKEFNSMLEERTYISNDIYRYEHNITKYILHNRRHKMSLDELKKYRDILEYMNNFVSFDKTKK